MNIDIINADRHRNGVGGRPFSVYLLDDHECGDTKVAIVFDDAPDCVAVLSIDLLTEGDIGFGSNSWRGDQYAWAISRLLEPAGR
jgi:hypothetical protein